MVVLDALVLGSAVLFCVATRVHAGRVGLHQVLALDVCCGVLTCVRYLDLVVVIGESLTNGRIIGLKLFLENTIVVALN
jgi:hypothetical protein